MSFVPSLIMPAMAGISTGLQAFGSASQGEAAHAAAQADAAVLEENARLANLDGAMEGEAIRRQARQVEGEAIARMGASGIALGTGSALEWLRESAYEAEYDVLQRRYEAAARARGSRLEAASRRRAGKDARTAGYLGAAASIITGASDFYAQTKAGEQAERGRAARRPPAPMSGMTMPVPPKFGPADWTGLPWGWP